jgi:hypothetical protein
MGAIFPFTIGAVHQTEVGFVGERRGLQRVIAPLATHLSNGHGTELGIEQTCELLFGLTAARANATEKRVELRFTGLVEGVRIGSGHFAVQVILHYVVLAPSA